MIDIDSSILQFVPKGAFYNTEHEQVKKMESLWEQFMGFDRTIFALSSLLHGTAYSKGRMSHMLLSNPLTAKDTKAIVPLGLDGSFESKVILFNLGKETMPRALKNLIMLAGGKKNKGKRPFKKVNNARTRKIILQFIFNRDINSLESMAIKYKKKLRELVTHAIGTIDVTKMLNGYREGIEIYDRYIGRWNQAALNVVKHLFDLYTPGASTKLDAYYHAREAAKIGDVDRFTVLASRLPFEVAMGFRNSYKLDVPIADLMKLTQMTDRQKVQSQSAAKRVGAKIEVDYTKQDIYDLFKLFYQQVFSGEGDNLDKIAEAIHGKTEEKQDIDFGESVVVMDASRSMEGSEKRPLHPFLTAMCAAWTLKNVVKVIYVGGRFMRTGCDELKRLPVPSGPSPLWRGLLEAAILNPETIIVISDGYENAIKGMFNQVYEHFTDQGFKFNLVHINPVFAAEVKGARRLVPDLKPLVLADHKYLETSFVFDLLQSHQDQVRQLLANKYKALIP